MKRRQAFLNRQKTEFLQQPSVKEILEEYTQLKGMTVDGNSDLGEGIKGTGNGKLQR